MVNAETIDLAALGSKAAVPGKGAVQPAVPGQTTRLFSDAVLPLPTAPALEAQLELIIGELRWPGPPAGTAPTALHTVIHLQDGAVEARPVAFKFAGAAVNGTAMLRLPGSTNAPGIQLQLQADGVQLDQALALTGDPHGVKGGRSDLRLDVSASGVSPHQRASSLSGEFRLRMGPVQWSGNRAGLGGDIATRLIEAVNPAHKRNQGNDLRCVAVRLPIQGGQIVIDRGIAMESEQLDVVASGEIDLGVETLALAFRPAVKKGLGMGVGVGDFAQLVQLRGSLSQPSIAVDLKGATREAASVGAAVATGGLSLIGQRLLKEKRDPHPCAAALSGGKAAGGAESKPGSAEPQAKTSDKPGILRGAGRR